jgi:sarcosine oxidase subunit alpha
VTGPFRLVKGGLIERGRALQFSFDGEDLTGHPGDTLASALLANGVRIVGRSFKYHRPRGIMSAGVEEATALLDIGNGAWREPNTRATDVFLYDGLEARSQNSWPSLGFDLFAVNDRLSRLLGAGFYYKTFLWPPRAWKLYEHAVRRAAGLGKPTRLPDPGQYDERFAFCDVLVIGGGATGLAAARSAAESGADVILSLVCRAALGRRPLGAR